MSKVEEIKALIGESLITSDKQRVCNTFKTKFSELDAVETSNIDPADLVKFYKSTKDSGVVAFYDTRTNPFPRSNPERREATNLLSHTYLANKYLTQPQIQSLINAIGSQTDALTGTMANNLKEMLLDLANSRKFEIKQPTPVKKTRPATAPAGGQNGQNTRIFPPNTTSKIEQVKQQIPNTPQFDGFTRLAFGSDSPSVKFFNRRKLNRITTDRDSESDENSSIIYYDDPSSPIFSPDVFSPDDFNYQVPSRQNLRRNIDPSQWKQVETRAPDISENVTNEELGRANVTRYGRPHTSPLQVKKDRRSGRQAQAHTEEEIAAAKEVLQQWVDAVGKQTGRNGNGHYDDNLNDVIGRIVTLITCCGMNGEELENEIHRETADSVETKDAKKIPSYEQRKLPNRRFLSDVLILATQHVTQKPTEPEVIDFLEKIGLLAPTQQTNLGFNRPGTPYLTPTPLTPIPDEKSPRDDAVSDVKKFMYPILEDESLEEPESKIPKIKGIEDDELHDENARLRAELSELQKKLLQKNEDLSRMLLTEQSKFEIETAQFHDENLQLQQTILLLEEQLRQQKPHEEVAKGLVDVGVQFSQSTKETDVQTLTTEHGAAINRRSTESLIPTISAVNPTNVSGANIGSGVRQEVTAEGKTAASSSSQIEDENRKKLNALDALISKRVGALAFARTIKVLETCMEKFRSYNSKGDIESVLKGKTLTNQQKFSVMNSFCDNFRGKSITLQGLENYDPSNPSSEPISTAMSETASSLFTHRDVIRLRFPPNQASDSKPSNSTGLRGAVGVIRALQHFSKHTDTSSTLK